MTQTIRTNDRDLQTKVTDELVYNPSIDAAHLGVSANDGVVTLSGDVGSLPERYAAKRAATRVSGVKAVADDIVVRDPGTAGTTDRDIIEAAHKMLSWAVDVPSDMVRVGVREHVVTLSGAVDWHYQREAAARAVMYLRSVTAITNAITLTSTAPTSGVKAAIDAAIHRNAQLDAREIAVGVNGGDVTLSGTVRSWAERRQATHVAWAAPGVANVANGLTVVS